VWAGCGGAGSRGEAGNLVSDVMAVVKDAGTIIASSITVAVKHLVHRFMRFLLE
jgi:hypothetical protein